MVEGPNISEFRGDGALRRIRALVVGGGATGQVYGYFLAQAGVEVSYYLKPRYAAEAEEGFDLLPFGLVGRRPKRHFGGFEVHTDHRVLRGRHFDQIWLCISAPALKSGVVPELNSACPDAVWVCLQPGLDAKENLLEFIPEQRIVMGMVGFIAYQSPLPGEKPDLEGVSYFLPPLSPTLFAGPHAERIANQMQKAGLPAGARPDVQSISQFGSAFLIPFVVALETAGWSLRALRKDNEALDRLAVAVSEAFDALEAAGVGGRGSLGLLTRRSVLKMALFAAPQLAPLPLETYLKYHFTKVRRQSEDVMRDFCDLAKKHGVDSTCLQGLEDLWYMNRPAIHETEALQTAAALTFEDLARAGSVEFAEGLAETTDPPPVGVVIEASEEDTGPLPEAAELEAELESGDLEANLDEASEPAARPEAKATVRDLPSLRAADGPPAEAGVSDSESDEEGGDAVEPDVDEPPGEVADTEKDKIALPLRLRKNTEPAKVAAPPPALASSLDVPTEEVKLAPGAPAAVAPSLDVPTEEVPTGQTAEPKTPEPKVEFKGDIKERLKKKLGKQDFIQTELPSEVAKSVGFDFKNLSGSLGTPPSAAPTDETPGLAERIKRLDETGDE